MAITEGGRVLTERHRLQQLGLRAATIRDIIRLFPMWTWGDPDSYNRFVEAVYTLAQARVRDSAALAVRYYERFRDVELTGGKPLTLGHVAAIVEPPSKEQIRASIDVTARHAVYKAINAGYPQEVAMQHGLAQVSGSVGRHVLNGGRDAVVECVRRDPVAVGWARVTDGDPCAFCAMVASRGPVYKEETVRFRAHDHCGCSAEPHYHGSAWPGNGRYYQDLWQKSTGNLSGQDAINAFRRALEKPG